MYPIRFGIDLDGVLADFELEVCKIVNSLWPEKINLLHTSREWNYTDVLSTPEWDIVWDRIINTENFWLCETELPGVSALRNFLDEYPDAQCYFITSRPKTKNLSTFDQSALWLQQRGLWGYPRHSSLIIVDHADDKKDWIMKYEIPYFLDDKASTIYLMTTIPGFISGRVYPYILDAPHNQYAHQLLRVSSVKEYLNIVSGAVHS